MDTETAVGIAIIAAAAVWLYRICERVMYWKWHIKMNGKDSGSFQKPSDFPDTAEQKDRVLYDVSLSLSEVVITTRRVERLLDKVEATLEHMDKHLHEDGNKSISLGGMHG